MEQKNIAEILKDCPKGMELDCILFKDTPVYLHEVITDTNYPIEIKVEYPCKELETFFLNKYGAIYDRTTANCVIFPKGKTTWEGFHKPFKDGDIVVTKTSHNFIFYSIYKGVENRKVLTYVDYHFDSNRLMFNDNLSSLCFIDDIVEQRFATEDEKQELFDAIKTNGYKWNEETKTLEKLIEPKFNVGDKVRHKVVNKNDVHEINRVHDDSYEFVGFPYTIPMKHQDKFELVPNKFDITTLKPFESRVLVRHNKDNKWCGSFFSHIDGNFHSHCYKYVTIAGKSYPMCIPYEGNEHLLGTTNDCIEYYKTWQEWKI